MRCEDEDVIALHDIGVALVDRSLLRRNVRVVQSNEEESLLERTHLLDDDARERTRRDLASRIRGIVYTYGDQTIILNLALPLIGTFLVGGFDFQLS